LLKQVYKNRYARRFLNGLSPPGGHRYLNYFNERRQRRSTVRQGVVTVPVRHALDVDVYWKELPIGRGPAAAVYAYGQEVARFDCFGAGRGHYHVFRGDFGNPDTGRVYFDQQQIESQIESTLDLICRQVPGILHKHVDPKIRSITVDGPDLEQAARTIRTIMRRYARAAPT